MRVPLSWLCDFAPFEGDAPTLAGALDDLGLVVEGVEQVGEGLADVVVAEVQAIAPIAGADKIRRVTVDGGSRSVDVVCGAWNFAVGDLVPLAPVGATLPGDLAIARRAMRGVTSDGMLCSGRELRLSDDQDGIMILGKAPDGPAPGTPLMDALGIDVDVVFDIAVEANRPDAWSMAGVARDLAAKLKIPFRIPEPPGITGPLAGPPASEMITVEVADDDLCPRFTAWVLTGLTVGPSPSWMAHRLALAGMRSINNVVDASNYVMLELGQPTHPYDLDRIAGGGLRARAARPGESLTTLDGIERDMGGRSVGPGDDRRDLLICDAEDNPVGIAGVMGGASSDIAPTTTRVLLEVAYFAPMAVARTAKRLGLRSEASARFERGTDPWGIDRAAHRLVELLAATAGADLRVSSRPVDRRGPVPEPVVVTLRTARVNAVLGTELGEQEVAELLRPIGFVCEPESPGNWQVTAPTFRPDTTREIDVVEEVARHHGYANIPRRRVRSPQVGRLSPGQRGRRQVRQLLTGLHADEAWTPSLVSPGDDQAAGLPERGVTVTNPLTPDESVLRRSLLPGLLRALAFNVGRRNDRIRLFEIGVVFPVPPPERVARVLARTGGTVIDEREHLAVLFAADGDDAEAATRGWLELAGALGLDDVELVAVTGDVVPGLHPTRSARLLGSDVGHRGDERTVLGAVGEIDPAVLEAFGVAGRRVGWLEAELQVLLRRSAERRMLLQPVSVFPSSDIDLAFVVDDAVPASLVGATIRSAAGSLLESLTLFDVFRGAAAPPGTRSLAYTLRLCAADRTLSGAELAEVRRQVIAAAADAHGARLRGG